MSNGNTPVIIRCPPDLLDAIDKRVDSRRTRQAVILRALAEYFRVDVKPPRRGQPRKEKADG